MHIVLTDLLTCPRCGPEFGLILLANRIEHRRVLEGALGCANCRERYPIEGGFADLRLPPAPPLPGPAAAPERGGRDEAFRLAALMGVAEGPGYSLIVGSDARLAPGVAALIQNLEVVAVDEALACWDEEPGISRLATSPRLPFRGRSMRAVALTGGSAEALLEEGIRVLGPHGRLVLAEAPEGVEERLSRAGLAVVAREGWTVVAALAAPPR